jgi:hypothetical protein
VIIVSTTVTPTPVPEPTLPGRRPQGLTPIPQQPYQGLTVLLTGVDGSTWDLTNGPVRMRPGAVGFLPGSVEPRWGGSPSLPGSTWRGHRVVPQNFTLPVLVHARPGLVFRDLDNALWRALVPGGECRLTVTTPDAVVRSIPVRFLGLDETTLDRDPFVLPTPGYALPFVAPDPYWRGDTVTQTFASTVPPPFYATSGAVLNIASGRSTANSRVRNDGDVPVWPLYAITGPVSSFRVGVGANTLDFGLVSEGDTVWIDTRPDRQTITWSRDGANSETAWARLTARKFEPIPAGADVPITVVLNTPGDSTSLLVELTPRYRRPW